MTAPRFDGLQDFVRHLEARGELLRVTAEVDPKFEVAEIVQRVIRQDGPGLLFERVKGADFPLAMNLYGSARRMEMAVGRPPEQIGRELIETFQRLNPPSLSKFWELRSTLLRARFMRPRMVSRAPVQEVVEAPRLDRLPNLWSWPRDGGPFITFGPTITHNPANGVRNFGLYRLQVFDEKTTGMHWQSMKGGRGHHHEAERRGEALEAAVVLGGDPMTMLSAILPLPEDFDELGLAGFLRGRATEFIPGQEHLDAGARQCRLRAGRGGAGGGAADGGALRRPLRPLLRSVALPRVPREDRHAAEKRDLSWGGGRASRRRRTSGSGWPRAR